MADIGQDENSTYITDQVGNGGLAQSYPPPVPLKLDHLKASPGALPLLTTYGRRYKRVPSYHQSSRDWWACAELGSLPPLLATDRAWPVLPLVETRLHHL